MEDKDRENLIKALNQVSKICNNSNCKDCIFAHIYEGCIFFSKPFDWNICAFQISTLKGSDKLNEL